MWDQEAVGAELVEEPVVMAEPKNERHPAPEPVINPDSLWWENCKTHGHSFKGPESWYIIN